MRFFPHSFNGFLFQQKDRVVSTFDDFDWDIEGITTQNAARLNNRPKYSGAILGGASKVVSIALNDVDRDRDSLVIAMDTLGPNQKEFFVLDELGNMWYSMAKFIRINTEGTDQKTASYGCIFDFDDPTWIRFDEVSDIWATPPDEGTHTITVGGNQNTNPIFNIRAGPPAGYYPYVRYIKNYNPVPYAQTDGIDLTGGGWDTAALVSGGKMLASGNDCRVFMDGAEIPRWFGGGGINSATTKVFSTIKWKPGGLMLLGAGLGTGTADPILIPSSTANRRILSSMPQRGMIRIENEEISYSSIGVIIDVGGIGMFPLEIAERGIRGTTAASHLVNSNCYWVEHDIRIVHGDTIAVAPIYDDTYKPVYDLATSTNTSRVYTVFADTNNLRAGSWIRQVINDGLGMLSRVYSGNHAAIPEVDPATEMGMEIASYQAQGYWKPETAQLAWMLYHPAGITTVTSTGSKFRSFTDSIWPIAAELASSNNGFDWVQEWNEVTPASPNTWTALANTSAETITGTYTPYVRYRLFGSVNGLASNYARMEVASSTVVLNSANVIQIGMSSEIANLQFKIQLRNNRTGESLFIDYPAEEGESLIIDSNAMTVTYKGINAIRAISWDTIRTDWLHFEPGPNELQYFENPAGADRITTNINYRGL